MTIIRDKFDFEIGYLVKSPCQDCRTRAKFPKCMDSCAILDEIQTLLARGISSDRSSSPLEDFSISFDVRRH